MTGQTRDVSDVIRTDVTDRLVREALDELRLEADLRERVYRVPQDAVEAMRIAMGDSPEMPAPGYDAQTRRRT